MQLKDITGQRFGHLKALRYAFHRKEHAYWLCRCECGTEVAVERASLNRPHVSCGCYRRKAVRERFTKHGLARSPEYFAWQALRQRCENPDNPAYKNYGGRGITVCERWASFPAFMEDMGRRPGPEYTIERENNDLGYAPDNCKWATRKEQGDNKRTTRRLRFKGQVKTLMQWAGEKRIKPATLHSRLREGWSTKDALTIPVGKWKSRRLRGT